MFVFLNIQKSSEHSRFDAAHELGHLALHKHAGAHGKEAEREANAFASSLCLEKTY
ncbi:ImmA/IrrE family metallo-endopeptidase [Vreelandella sulfidaeris]